MTILKFKNNGEGFTLIEVIVSIAIFVMIGGAVVTFQRSVITNSKVIQSGFTSQQQIRKTLTLFVADTRSATRSGAGSYPIEVVSTTSVTFYANIDKDPLIERVRYFLATTTLMRGILKPTGTTTYNPANETVSSLVFDVTNATSSPIFTFYDKNYDGFTSSSTDPLPQPIDISAIRLIKMSLTVNPNGVRSPVMQTYVTQAMLRNLKDNL